MMDYNDFDGKCFSEKVIDYIQQGKTDEISRLMQDCDISSQVDSQGMTLLHLSARFGTKSMTKFLIESNVPIESIDINGDTALLLAFTDNNVVNVEQAYVLLEAGANVLPESSSKCLLYFVFRQMTKISPDEYVLLAKVIMDRIEQQCSFDSENIASLLIKFDIPVSYIGFFRSDVARAFLKRGYDVNSRNILHNCSNSALHNATVTSDLEIVRTLLKFGAGKCIENGFGFIPFELMRYSQNVEIMLLLIPDEQFLNERYRNSLKLYPMLSSGSKHFLELILQHCNINLTAKDNYRRTPLQHLVLNSNEDLWELFQNVELGDVNSQDATGRTAMHYALPRIEAVRFLLDKGARFDVVHHGGRPPFFYGMESYEMHYTPEQCRDCIDLILERGFDVQYITVKEESLFSLCCKYYIIYHKHDKLCEYVYASVLEHLVMLNVVRSVPIEPLILRHINSCKSFKELYRSAKEQLEKLKTTFVFDNVTFFRLLVVNEDQINGYARNDEIFEKVIQIDESTSSYYIRYLRNRFLEAKQFSVLRDNAAKVVEEIMNVHYRNYVVELIVSYLSKADLKLFA